jgi:dimethylhistidine N-methyltransferase
MNNPNRADRYQFFDRSPGMSGMYEEVVRGLQASPRQLPPKYFYDERGSRLFEAITRLPEYYLTRTEMALFDQHEASVAAALGSDACLVEYGSGSSQKIRKVLQRARPEAYVPVDISADHLERQAAALSTDFPWLRVYPTCADFTQPFKLPEPVAALSKVGFFPGSSIGNFEPRQAVSFLRNVRETLGPGGRMLVGVDRKKDISVLEAAYNDAQGITGEFNLNLLRHINVALGANFDLNGFAHEARYNEQRDCIQMFLRSRRRQRVQLGSQAFEFAEGEAIHTENSFKYDPDGFMALARDGGFVTETWWTDHREWFALYLLRAEA